MLNVYLSGEIHTDWRNEIISQCKQEGLEINFTSPVTDHELSDNCGVKILGEEKDNYWKEHNNFIDIFMIFMFQLIMTPVSFILGVYGIKTFNYPDGI